MSDSKMNKVWALFISIGLALTGCAKQEINTDLAPNLSPAQKSRMEKREKSDRNIIKNAENSGALVARPVVILDPREDGDLPLHVKIPGGMTHETHTSSQSTVGTQHPGKRNPEGSTVQEETHTYHEPDSYDVVAVIGFLTTSSKWSEHRIYQPLAQVTDLDQIMNKPLGEIRDTGSTLHEWTAGFAQGARGVANLASGARDVNGIGVDNDNAKANQRHADAAMLDAKTNSKFYDTTWAPDTTSYSVQQGSVNGGSVSTHVEGSTLSAVASPTQNGGAQVLTNTTSAVASPTLNGGTQTFTPTVNTSAVAAPTQIGGTQTFTPTVNASAVASPLITNTANANAEAAAKAEAAAAAAAKANPQVYNDNTNTFIPTNWQAQGQGQGQQQAIVDDPYQQDNRDHGRKNEDSAPCDTSDKTGHRDRNTEQDKPACDTSGNTRSKDRGTTRNDGAFMFKKAGSNLMASYVGTSEGYVALPKRPVTPYVMPNGMKVTGYKGDVLARG